MANDIRDLAMMPPGADRDAAMASGRSRVEAFLAANSGVLGGQRAEAVRRQLTVVAPAMAEIRGVVQRGGIYAPETAPAAVGAPAGAPTVGWLDRLDQDESIGRDRAQNSRSSATGRFQFIERTWLRYAAENPAGFVGLSPTEVLERRNDPAESRRAAVWYAGVNAAELQAAGVPAGPGEQALAHFAGGAGAIALLRADPAASAVAVLGPDAAKANPHIVSMTAGDLVRRYRSRFGGVDGASPEAPTAAAAQVVTALLGGPGMPGWNPAWAGLTDLERRDLANRTNALVSHLRGEIQWAEGRRNRAQSVTEAGLQFEAMVLATATGDQSEARTALQERTMGLAASAGLGPDGAARVMRTLFGDASRVAAARATQEAARATQATQEASARATQEAAVMRDASRMAAAQATQEAAVMRQEQALSAIGSQRLESNPNAQRILTSPTLTIAQQNDMLEREVVRMAAEDKALREQMEPARLVREALAGNRAMKPSDAPELGRQMEALGMGRDTWMTAQPGPVRDRMVATVTAAISRGVVPEQLARFFQQNGGAFSSATAYRNANAFWSAFSNNPEARAAIVSAINPRTLAAFDASAERVSNLGPEGTTEGTTRSEVALMMEQTRALMLAPGRDRAAIQLQLGTNEAEITTRLTGLVDKEVANARGWIAWLREMLPLTSVVRAIAPEYRAAIERAYYHQAQFASTPEAAMESAVKSLEGRWGVSSTATPRSGRLEPGDGGARFVQFPPEQYRAPSAPGGRAGSDWQQDYANMLLRQNNIAPLMTLLPNSPARIDVERRLGEQAFWQFDAVRHRDTGEVRHQLFFSLTRNGVPFIYHVPDVGTGRNLSVDLAAEARLRTSLLSGVTPAQADQAAAEPARAAQEAERRLRVRGNFGRRLVEGMEP